MTDYTFDLKSLLGPNDRIGIESSSYQFNIPDENLKIKLTPQKRDLNISESSDLILTSTGWTSKDQARDISAKFLHAFMFAFARARVGVDFGLRIKHGKSSKNRHEFITTGMAFGLSENKYGIEIYESTQRQSSITIGEPRFIITTSINEIENSLNFAFNNSLVLSNREMLSLETYNASFFETRSDTKFLLRFIAVEALIDLKNKPEDTIEHIDYLITVTRASSCLNRKDKDSITTSLRALKIQSTRQGGLELSNKYLGSKTYMGLTAPRFFLKCYDTRNNLVHGRAPFPTIETVSSLAANLQTFIPDLITAIIMEKYTEKTLDFP